MYQRNKISVFRKESSWCKLQKVFNTWVKYQLFFNPSNFTGKNKKKKEQLTNPIVELIARKRAQLVRLAHGSQAKDQSSDSSDSGTAVSNHWRHTSKRKRRRTFSTSSESNKSSASPPTEKRKKVLVWDEGNSSDVVDVAGSPSTTAKEPSTSSETPDSGIALPERSSSSKFKSRPHRNYRRHLLESDSD